MKFTLLLIAFLCEDLIAQVQAKFYIEIVESIASAAGGNGGQAGQVFERRRTRLYECTGIKSVTPPPTPGKTPRKRSAKTSAFESNVIRCNKVRFFKEHIYSSANFYTVSSPVLTDSQSILFTDSRTHQRLPTFVNIGFLPNEIDCPDLYFGDDEPYFKQLVEKIGVGTLVTTVHFTSLARYLALSNIVRLSTDTMTLMAYFPAYTSTLDKATGFYYKEIVEKQRTAATAQKQTPQQSQGTKLQESILNDKKKALRVAVQILSSKMIDPCRLQFPEADPPPGDQICKTYCGFIRMVTALTGNQLSRWCRKIKEKSGQCVKNVCQCSRNSRIGGYFGKVSVLYCNNAYRLKMIESTESVLFVNKIDPNQG